MSRQKMVTSIKLKQDISIRTGENIDAMDSSQFDQNMQLNSF